MCSSTTYIALFLRRVSREPLTKTNTVLVRRGRARPRGGHPLQLVAILEVKRKLVERDVAIQVIEADTRERDR